MSAGLHKERIRDTQRRAPTPLPAGPGRAVRSVTPPVDAPPGSSAQAQAVGTRTARRNLPATRITAVAAASLA